MSHSLLDDAVVKDRVQKAWNVVFAASNKVLVDEKRFGFTGMGVIPDPNIHQLVVLLRALDAVLNSIASEFDDLAYDDTRLLLNAREQITRMERVAAALRSNNIEDFNDAIQMLEQQAPF